MLEDVKREVEERTEKKISHREKGKKCSLRFDSPYQVSTLTMSSSSRSLHGIDFLSAAKSIKVSGFCWPRRLSGAVIISSFVLCTCLSQPIDRATVLFFPLIVLRKASSADASSGTFLPWSLFRNGISRGGTQSPSPATGSSSGARNIAGLSGGDTSALNESVACLFVTPSSRSSTVSSTYVKTAAVTASTRKATLLAVPKDSSNRLQSSTEVAATTTKFPSITDPSIVKNVHNDIPQASAAHAKPMKVLFLSSDTGGGHRASAESLAKQFLRLYPGSTYDLLDVWTADGTYPYKTLVGAYKHLSRHPRQWQFLYHLSNFPLYELFMDLHSCFMCEKKIRNRIASYNPDVVVSVHPAMNYTPMRAVNNICKEMSSMSHQHKIPFFTVVTDYGSAHCTWFQRRVEKIFVASERLRKLARRRGFIPKSKIVMSGLPIRQDFHEQATALGGDRTSPQGKAYRGKVRHALGIEPNSKAILLMGGGEGVGSLSDIVNALYKTLVQRGIDSTLLVVCGRNEKLRKQLRTRNWDEVLKNSSRKARSYNLIKRCIGTLNRRTGTKMVASHQHHQQGKVRVVDLGFVNDMAEYMVAADVLVSKAGPGTIAEAAAVGLPVMLSSFLPGQEAGNVDIVLDGKFGAFCKNPNRIANQVASWLEDDNLLDTLSRNSMKEGHPTAAADIVREIGEATQACIAMNQQQQQNS